MAARKQKAGPKRKRMPARTVEDEDYQLRHEKVAGIDIAKASGMICLRLPAEAGKDKRYSKVWETGATVTEIEALAGELTAAGVELISMESTGDYWRVWVRHEAHCCIARSAGGNRRRCFSDLMAYQGPKG